MVHLKKRHLQLIRLLNRGRRFTADELATETGASVRTIQRDMFTLEELGYPIWSVPGTGGGYEMLPNRLLPPLQLREQEAVALYLTLKWMEQIPDVPFGDMRDTLSDWYVNELPHDLEMKIARLEKNILWLGNKTVPPAPFTKDVYEAVERKRKVEMTYATTKGQRTFTIEPVGMALLNFKWYVFGLSDYGLRQYRIDRVEALRLLDKTFEADDLATLLEAIDERTGVTVRLNITPLGRRLLEDVLPDIAEKNEWDVPEAELPFLSRQLLAAGAEVEVVAPIELREMMRDQTERLWDLYR
ncbi:MULTISPECIES: YafY family protein [unclassified Exiguobacterium]|uniref:helix-turn-helix transcriptional regulator n=1 Tax=unclassified Exiguobacterium TaxID=2644629 RepID=UPI00103E3D67|nr:MULTISPECIES: WYL domain-containing protein [unclassified Exiguobacterium]TCI25098.1 WYL domain-containing protein [Exiguobacterium sp. SH5S4]TCI63203.1 WYL domain-containing protein [Exiguobacterium sp. SH0S2]TCI77930.1 WYL domain-containing protein [Exiguobacterium sp. SH0S1]